MFHCQSPGRVYSMKRRNSLCANVNLLPPIMSGAGVATRAVMRNLRQRGSSSPEPMQAGLDVATCPVGDMGGTSSHVAFSITHDGSAFRPGSKLMPPLKSRLFVVSVQLAEVLAHAGSVAEIPGATS